MKGVFFLHFHLLLPSLSRSRWRRAIFSFALACGEKGLQLGRERKNNEKNERASKQNKIVVERKKENATSTSSLLLQKPLHQFDSAFLAALSTKVAGRASFKGGLDTYRFCDSVWTFLLRDAVVKLPAGPGGRPPAREEIVKKIKIVAVDSRLAATTTAAGAK